MSDESPDGFETKGQVIALGPPRRARLSPYVNAALVTQLLAIHDQHPQWRKNRRMDEGAAIRAYTDSRTEKNPCHFLTRV